MSILDPRPSGSFVINVLLLAKRWNFDLKIFYKLYIFYNTIQIFTKSTCLEIYYFRERTDNVVFLTSFQVKIPFDRAQRFLIYYEIESCPRITLAISDICCGVRLKIFKGKVNGNRERRLRNIKMVCVTP